ncbi:MAG: 50S ribosomal protein L24 [Mycoplasmataceae bacterium]|jgi:large subunit ribosomal protein L24|nr:50S ribosomal protein L24 [Mycoplasmataceae bacterium]
MQRIVKGDKVRVISGKEKSKEGIVLSVNKAQKTAIVEGLNIVKIHQKPSQQNQDKGGIFDKEAGIKLCKLAIVDPKSKNGISKVKFIMKDEHKVRIGRKTNSPINKAGKK